MRARPLHFFTRESGLPAAGYIGWYWSDGRDAVDVPELSPEELAARTDATFANIEEQGRAALETFARMYPKEAGE